MTSRTTKDAPFCWQSKEALRRVRDWFDESNNIASALATYLALSEIESNSGTSGPFIATQSDIAKRAGVGQRTVRTILAGQLPTKKGGIASSQAVYSETLRKKSIVHRVRIS